MGASGKEQVRSRRDESKLELNAAERAVETVWSVVRDRLFLCPSVLFRVVVGFTCLRGKGRTPWNSRYRWVRLLHYSSLNLRGHIPAQQISLITLVTSTYGCKFWILGVRLRTLIQFTTTTSVGAVDYISIAIVNNEMQFDSKLHRL